MHNIKMPSKFEIIKDAINIVLIASISVYSFFIISRLAMLISYYYDFFNFFYLNLFIDRTTHRIDIPLRVSQPKIMSTL